MAAFRAWLHRCSLTYREYDCVAPANPGTKIVTLAALSVGVTVRWSLLRKDRCVDEVVVEVPALALQDFHKLQSIPRRVFFGFRIKINKCLFYSVGLL